MVAVQTTAYTKLRQESVAVGTQISYYWKFLKVKAQDCLLVPQNFINKFQYRVQQPCIEVVYPKELEIYPHSNYQVDVYWHFPYHFETMQANMMMCLSG